MASPAVSDFLTKEIKVAKNIVTFRLLSRQLSIHVNDAKRELESYYLAAQKTKDPVFATFVLSGPAALDADAEKDPASGRGDLGAPGHLMLLVPEDRLEAVKNRFSTPPAQHVYSLSPVPLKDHGLLVSVSERVRALDLQKGQDHAAQVGMLLSKEAPWSGSSGGRPKPKRTSENPAKPNVSTAKPPNKPTNPPPTPSKSTSNATQTSKEPGRQSALDFGRATKKTASGDSKKDQTRATIKVNEKIQRPAVAVGRAKRILDSSDEDEPTPAQQRPVFKRKKSHATSDDDENSECRSDAAPPRPGSLKAMMHVDDDGVVNGRSTRSPTPEHVPSAREVAAAAKAAKAEAKAAKAEALKGVDRKEPTSRKRVPKGKRRVIRSRRIKNAKGYMVTEDYSSYEDVDPNETDKNDSGADTEPDQEQDSNKKSDTHKEVAGKSSVQKTGAGSTKRRQSESSGTVKKSKPSATAKPGQQKLASFFGKK
ncbi:DNA polymerase subunit Cdc27 [Ceratobasidium sp. AG-Ba]|nr:DNA polymerase subunit Cdc27 [Ceratobasidium sp. AG-Ba]QRW03902.1 DNA polymerase subunit Cdc27 [Ceratobasidium sp. AG-Ba]